MLPFVGATLSARIIDYREKHGGYDSVGQLVEIYGIGPRNLEKIRPYLFCN
jgi:competence protein ComEA